MGQLAVTEPVVDLGTVVAVVVVVVEDPPMRASLFSGNLEKVDWGEMEGEVVLEQVAAAVVAQDTVLSANPVRGAGAPGKVESSDPED